MTQSMKLLLAGTITGVVMMTAATGLHAHGWPYFVVMLTDAVMKIEAPDGAVF